MKKKMTRWTSMILVITLLLGMSLVPRAFDDDACAPSPEDDSQGAGVIIPDEDRPGEILREEDISGIDDPDGTEPDNTEPEPEVFFELSVIEEPVEHTDAIHALSQLSGDPKEIVQVKAGDGFTLLLIGDGSVWSWGSNETGQLGDGATANRMNIERLSSLNDIVKLDIGENYGLALKMDGTVWFWGDNTNQISGDGSSNDRPIPTQVPGLENIYDIAAGHNHALALKADGTVWAWGASDYLGLGSDVTSSHMQPTQVDIDSVESVYAGDDSSVAVKLDGSVWIWGDSDYWRLGNGTMEVEAIYMPPVIYTPVENANLSGFEKLFIENHNGYGVVANGDVFSWGHNQHFGSETNGSVTRPVYYPFYGVGDGTTISRGLPTRIELLDGAKQISRFGTHSLAVKEDGSVWIWGDGEDYKLGTGTTSAQTTPTQMEALSDVKLVSAGSSHSVAVKDDNTIWVWGATANHQLGPLTGSSHVQEPTQVFGAIFGPRPIYVDITYLENSGYLEDESKLHDMVIRALYPGDEHTVMAPEDFTIYNDDFLLFTGWNTKIDGSGDWYQPGDTLIMPYTNLLLYAQWEYDAKEWVFIVYSYGMFNLIASENVISGEEYMIRDREGLEFPPLPFPGLEIMYWIDQYDNEYALGQVINPTYETILDAMWVSSSDVIDVTYDSNDSQDLTFTGYGAPDQAPYAVLNEQTAKMARENYVLQFWNTRSDGSGESYDPDSIAYLDASSGSLTLYAVWEYTGDYVDITYWPNSGRLEDDSKYHDLVIRGLLPGEEHTVMASEDFTMYHEICEFIGWNTEEDSSGDWYQPGDTLVMQEANVALFAQWKLVAGDYVSVIYFTGLGNDNYLDDIERGSEYTIKSQEETGLVLPFPDFRIAAWLDEDSNIYAIGETITLDSDLSLLAYLDWGEIQEVAYLQFNQERYVIKAPGSAAVKAAAYDSAGVEISYARIVYTLAEAYDGVSIDDRTGMLTITAAAVRNIRVIASCNGFSAETLVVVTDDSGVADLLFDSSVYNLSIPAAGQSTVHAVARAYGWLGVEVEGAEITYSFVEERLGVSIDVNDGTITVTSEAQPGELTLLAEYGRLTASATLNLSYPESPPTVGFEAEEYYTGIPKEHAPYYVQVKAKVISPDGEELPGANVSYSMTDYPGVSIDSSTGVVAINSEALPGETTIHAEYDGSTDTGKLIIVSHNVIKDIAVGHGFSLAVDQSGSVWAWGKNENMTLGLGNDDFNNRYSPTKVSSLEGMVSVSAGSHHSVALKEDGTVWTWGYNEYGHLGDGTKISRGIPEQIPDLDDVVAITATVTNTFAVKSDGTVWILGTKNPLTNKYYDYYGVDGLSPVQIHELTDIVQVAAGSQNYLALDSNGDIWACGHFRLGTFGLNESHINSPIKLSGIKAKFIAASEHALMILTTDNEILYNGSVSNNTWLDSDIDLDMLYHKTLYNISTGQDMLAVDTDGEAWSLEADQTEPIKLDIVDYITHISAFQSHYMALSRSGQLWSWGSNSFGELGLGDNGESEGERPTFVSSFAGDVYPQSISFNQPSYILNAPGRVAVQATVLNNYGQIVHYPNIQYSLVEEYEGIILDNQTGELTITQLTSAKEITVQAYYEGLTTDVVVLINYAGNPAEIVFGFSEYIIAIPKMGTLTMLFQAKVYDLFGDELDGVTYELTEAYFGVDIDSQTGLVSISPRAKEGSVGIIASYGDSTAQVKLIFEIPDIATYEVSTTAGNYYSITLAAQNIISFEEMEIIIEYDTQIFELDDLSVFTSEKETTAGAIPVLGIIITEVSDGQFKISVDTIVPENNLWAGVVSSFRLRAKETGITVIHVK